MKSSIISALAVLFLLQFIGFSAHAMSCKGVVGSRRLTLNVIAKRLRQGAEEASGSLQSLEADGVLEGYYSAVAVGVSPRQAKALVLAGAKVSLYSSSITKASQAYYTAVGLGLSPEEVSSRIQIAKMHEPIFTGKHGQIEGYYLAVVFGVDPAVAASAVQYDGQQTFPNMQNFKNLLTAFYAGLASGISPKEAGLNLDQAHRFEDRVPSALRKGVLSGFYFASVAKNDLEN